MYITHVQICGICPNFAHFSFKKNLQKYHSCQSANNCLHAVLSTIKAFSYLKLGSFAPKCFDPAQNLLNYALE